MSSVYYLNRTVAELDYDSVAGRRAVAGGILVLRLRIRAHELRWDREQPGSLVLTHCDLKCNLGQLPSTAPLMNFTCLVGTNNEQTIGLPVALSSEQIVALDRARSDHGLALALDVCGVIDGPDGLQHFSLPLNAQITNAVWCDVLKGMEYEHREFVEVVVSSSEMPDELKEASRNYGIALSLLTKRQWREAVAAARVAIDLLNLDGPKEINKDQNLLDRVKHLRLAARHVAHAGPHPIEIGDPGPDEARFVVHMVGLVLEHRFRAGR